MLYPDLLDFGDLLLKVGFILLEATAAYLASFMGLIFAWIHYKRKKPWGKTSGDGRS